jgi:uncharacterized phosphosugar-binding protein
MILGIIIYQEEMMNKGQEYLSAIQNVIVKFKNTQQEAIEKAADRIVFSFMNNGMLHIIGTGHSHMMAEEFFDRAGGFSKINPIFDEGLMMHNGSRKSGYFERLHGYAEIVLSRFEFNKNDTIMIVSNSGRNAVPIETALIMKEKGIFSIALTNLTHSKEVKSRHSSGKKLYELCDMVIDNCGILGDALIPMTANEKMGASSTIIGCIAVHWISALVAEKLMQKGLDPEVINSGNIEGSEEKADLLYKKYNNLIKAL